MLLHYMYVCIYIYIHILLYIILLSYDITNILFYVILSYLILYYIILYVLTHRPLVPCISMLCAVNRVLCTVRSTVRSHVWYEVLTYLCAVSLAVFSIVANTYGPHYVRLPIIWPDPKLVFLFLLSGTLWPTLSPVHWHPAHTASKRQAGSLNKHKHVFIACAWL